MRLPKAYQPHVSRRNHTRLTRPCSPSGPPVQGRLLADEVGLGKTIEAGLVLSQTWAERRRRACVIVPATLRKQWQQELLEKFALPSIILESRT